MILNDYENDQKVVKNTTEFALLVLWIQVSNFEVVRLIWMKQVGTALLELLNFDTRNMMKSHRCYK